jgi:rubrerythrin
LSKIAFKPEDAISERTERKMIEKAEKRNRLYKFVCPSCKHVEFGGPTTIVLKNVDPVTGKESILGHVHRRCPECGTNMVKYRVKEEKKK